MPGALIGDGDDGISFLVSPTAGHLPPLLWRHALRRVRADAGM
jgi:hypothetical protein